MRAALPLVVRLLTGIAVAAGLLAATAVPAAAVGGGYGPVGPDPATSLGLNVPVLSARTLGPDGGVVSATDGGRTVRLTVPTGWLGGPTQVAIVRLTEEAGMALAGDEYDRGWAYVTGYGVSFQPVDGGTATQGAATGEVVDGQLRLEITSAGLVRAGDEALRVRENAVLDLPVTPGDVLSAVLSGPAAVLLLRPAADTAPQGSRQPTVSRPSGSTALPRTGSDPTPLLLVGVGLLLAGAGVAAGARRRSRG
jgi:LPXTG-motif cell wall-anchored protein